MEKLGIMQEKKRKYNNRPEQRGNVHFDSQKEARRYDELLMLQTAQRIRNLKLQPQFTLQESYLTPEGDRVRAIRYVADFSYEVPAGEGQWRLVVEDVKSKATKTKQYEMKRKMMLNRFCIKIEEV